MSPACRVTMARLVLGRRPDGVGPPVAGGLALAVQGVDLVHLDAEGLLDGLADVDLGGLGVDHEDVDVVVHQAVGLLGDDRSAQDRGGVPHDATSPSSERRALSRRRPRRLGGTGQGLVGEDHPVVAQHVVGGQLGGQDRLDVGQVAEGPLGHHVVLAQHDQHPARRAPSAARAATASLVLGTSQPQASTRATRSAGGPVRQGRAQRQPDHLLRGPLPVAAGLGPEGHAAARPVRGAGRARRGPGRSPSGGRAWPRRPGPRPGSWSTGSPAGPPPAGPSPPGA